MQYGDRFVLPHYKGSVSGMDTQVERVMPPPPSPHQLWAGQETRKEAELQVQIGHCLWKGTGCPASASLCLQARPEGSRLGRWQLSSLERYSMSRAVTRNEEGREETKKGLACQREAMDLITWALRNLKDDQC